MTVILFSSLSDYMGRKVTVAIPYVGGSLVGIAIALFVAFDLPFWFYYIASFWLGFSGSSMAMLAGVFASAADVTSREQRKIAVAVIKFCNGVAIMFANVTSGLWVRETGFLPAVGFMSASMIAAGVFFLLMRETWPSSRRSDVPRTVGRVQIVKKQLQHMRSVLVKGQLRKKQICVLFAAFTLTDVSHTSLQSTLTLYVMGEPFCWNPTSIGVFSAGKVIFIMIGATLTVIVCRRTASDLSLSMVGAASQATFQFLLGFSSLFQSWIHNLVFVLGEIPSLFAALFQNLP